MLWAWLTLALAWGAPSDASGTCVAREPNLPDSLSVVWLAPAGRTVFAHQKLTVVATRSFRTWSATEGNSLQRTLSGLGKKRGNNRTKRPWQAVVFEVSRDQLCRPVADAEPGSLLGGVAVCAHQDKGIEGKHDDCAHAIDRLLDKPSLDLFHIRWKDAATRGFCVLPAERFLRGD